MSQRSTNLLSLCLLFITMLFSTPFPPCFTHLIFPLFLLHPHSPPPSLPPLLTPPSLLPSLPSPLGFDYDCEQCKLLLSEYDIDFSGLIEIGEFLRLLAQRQTEIATRILNLSGELIMVVGPPVPPTPKSPVVEPTRPVVSSRYSSLNLPPVGRSPPVSPTTSPITSPSSSPSYSSSSSSLPSPLPSPADRSTVTIPLSPSQTPVLNLSHTPFSHMTTDPVLALSLVSPDDTLTAPLTPTYSPVTKKISASASFSASTTLNGTQTRYLPPTEGILCMRVYDAVSLKQSYKVLSAIEQEHIFAAAKESGEAVVTILNIFY